MYSPKYLCLKEERGSSLCLLARIMMLSLLRADAGLDYWQAAFAPKMRATCFEGRGWGTRRAGAGDGQQDK